MPDTFPFSHSTDPFGAPLNGVFGRFRTDESHPVAFISTSIPVDNLDLLHTASEAFDVGNLSFDELVQRDIDHERVLGIVENYLKGANEKVVFFPPLLASVTISEEGAIKSQYESIEDNEDGDWMARTWDHNKFQVRFPISKEPQEMKLTFFPPGHDDGVEKYVFSFGCQLRWNHKLTKLVVIDGQHRLSALKKVLSHPGGKDILPSASIPVCILFPEEATAELRPGEDIKVDLRELFVTINNTGKQVSGHFLTLLSDTQLSALCVRELAEAWKTDTYSVATRLHQLEWNQRSAQRAYQREHVYSVTTVSIVADALNKSVFDPKEAGLTKLLLNLSEVQHKLESDNEEKPGIADIHEDNFSITQRDTLRHQARKTIVPALTTLFQSPRPYRSAWEGLKRAVDWMNEEANKDKKGAVAYRDEVFLQYRRTNKLDQAQTRQFEEEFDNKVLYHIDESDRTYFLLVFEQGLIAAWATLAGSLVAQGYTPESIANALVSGMECCVFDNKKHIFDPSRSYTQNVLYAGERVLLRSTSKEQWPNLILATLRNESSLGAFIGSLSEADDTAATTVIEIANQAYEEYLDEYYRKVEQDFHKNWRDKDFDAQIMQQFEEAYRIKEEGDPTQFEELVAKQASNKYRSAKERLDAVIEV